MGKGFTRNYAKGKSFDFSVWNPEKTYVNDDYKQDFVTYQGKLYACIKTNTNIVPTEDFYWTLCVEFLGGETIQVSSFTAGYGEPDKYHVYDGSIYLNLENTTLYEFQTDTWAVVGKIQPESDLEWSERD